VKRRVFTMLSALSLLLCVATVALWVRSYRWADRVEGTIGMRPKWSQNKMAYHGMRSYRLQSRRGTFSFGTDYRLDQEPAHHNPPPSPPRFHAVRALPTREVKFHRRFFNVLGSTTITSTIGSRNGEQSST
jgi:hypothetical protein